jgi:MacB-like periplasmic core domain
MTRLLRRIAFWLRFRRNQAALAEEIELHRSMTRERLERAGLNGGEAARASSRALGNVTLARGDAREIWTWRWLDGVAQDLRYGVRSLRRQPGFALTAVLTLSIGIGLNTTVATMFLSMYWRSWSVPNPADVVHIMTHDSRGVSYEFLYSRYKHLADNARLASIVATNCGTSGRSVECRMKLGGEPVLAEFVSPNYFRALAIGLDRGRSFLDDEDRPDAPGAVAVISHSLWVRRFSSDPDILGKTIELDDEPFTVVGVAARGFNGTALLQRDVWLPLATGRLIRPTSRDVTWVELAARLAPGVSREQAQAELQSLYAFRDPGTQQPVTIRLVGTSGFPHPNDRREGFAFSRSYSSESCWCCCSPPPTSAICCWRRRWRAAVKSPCACRSARTGRGSCGSC